jgi:hypothetical protein
VRRSKAIGILANPARALALLETHAGPVPGEDPVSASDLHPAQDDSDDREDRDDSDDDACTSETAAEPRGGRGDAAGEGLWPGQGGRARDERAGVPEPAAASRPSDDTPDDTPTGTPVGDPAPFTRPAASAALCLDPAKLLPKAVLYVHVSREAFDAALAGRQSGVARMEGVGPLTTAQAAAFLGHSHVTLTEVVDLETDHPVDGYETPTKMHEQLRLRSPAQVFPYAGLATVGMDVDHTKPYLPRNRGGPPGQTRIGNLGHLGRRLHRLKTHGHGWRHRQPEPGVHLWRSPHGYRYRVDNTGTHPLGKMPRPDPDSSLEHAFVQIIERLT